VRQAWVGGERREAGGVARGVDTWGELVRGLDTGGEGREPQGANGEEELLCRGEGFGGWQGEPRQAGDIGGGGDAGCGQGEGKRSQVGLRSGGGRG
jgi:hypothetical protein